MTPIAATLAAQFQTWLAKVESFAAKAKLLPEDAALIYAQVASAVGPKLPPPPPEPTFPERAAALGLIEVRDRAAALGWVSPDLNFADFVALPELAQSRGFLAVLGDGEVQGFVAPDSALARAARERDELGDILLASHGIGRPDGSDADHLAKLKSMGFAALVQSAKTERSLIEGELARLRAELAAANQRIEEFGIPVPPPAVLSDLEVGNGATAQPSGDGSPE